MKTYYFNVVRNATYAEVLQIGVLAKSPEDAETAVDNYLEDDVNFPVKELMVTERNLIDNDTLSVVLIEDTELLEESANENDDEPGPERA